MKPLKQYCKSNHFTQKEFARLTGMSEIHIASIIQGKRKPSLTLAKKIETVTNGAVTVQMLADSICPPDDNIPS